MYQLPGQCHCENIQFELVMPVQGLKIKARACGCNFCTKHGGVYTSHPDAVLRVNIKNMEQVNRYLFGTETAEFYICKICGAVPFVTSFIDDHLYAVVNVNTILLPDEITLDRTDTDFDDENLTDRLGRRATNWIPGVTINTG